MTLLKIKPKQDSAKYNSFHKYSKPDDGATNYTTLQNRVQAGRVGLMGGQTMSAGTTDNAGNTYLAVARQQSFSYYGQK